MPIKGLSEKRKLPRVGKIHLGEKVQGAGKAAYPKATDYFVVRPDETTSPKAAEAFKKIYGERPKELEVCFPVDETEIIFPQFYKQYKRSGLVCKGDGQTADRWEDKDNGMKQKKQISCVGPEQCEYVKQLGNGRYDCSPIAHLQFLLWPRVPILGIWQIDTGSLNSIIDLNSDLDMIRSLTNGRIRMIPLSLTLRPKEVNPDGRKKVVYTLHAEYRGSHKNLSDLMQRKPEELGVDAIPHDEVPADLRPDVSAEPHPLSNALPAPPDEPAPEPESQEEPPGVEVDQDHPILNEIQQEFYRLGISEEATKVRILEQASSKEKLLATLQKSRPTKGHVEWLRKQGHDVDDEGRPKQRA